MTKRLLLLLVVFLISVGVRLPNLNRPLSKHHEFVTAVSLRVLQCWEQEGAINHGLNPLMNYSGEANKYIDNHATSLGKMMDDEGNYYYVSHPPLAYVLPYACFQLFGVKSTVLSLQVFHLIFHFICAIFVFLIIRELGGSNRQSWIGYLLYIFLPATLWFQSNTYMSDMLVHAFFVIGIWMILKWLKSNGSSDIKYAFLFFALFFGMTYTSWLAVFFGGVVGIIGLSKFRERKGKLLLISTFLGGIGALSLMLVQYGSINGLSNYLDQMMQRFAVRGSNSVESEYNFFVQKSIEIGTIGFNYLANYLPLLLVVIFGWKYWKKSETNTEDRKRFVQVSLIPVVLLHLILMNYSGHDFTVLYASVFLSVAGAFIISKWPRSEQRIAISSVIGVSLIMYLIINLPGSESIKGGQYAVHKVRGEEIRRQTEDDEVVFWWIGKVDPMTIVYAGRNMKEVDSKEEAIEFLKERGLTKGRIFLSEARHLEGEAIRLE